MSDAAQIYMENVLHITGYLHRLLFLMKELDFKEYEINKLIREKEEIYLENLNYLSRNRIDRQGSTYLTGQSSLQNEELLPELENQGGGAECAQLSGRGAQGGLKEEDPAGGDSPMGGTNPVGDNNPVGGTNPMGGNNPTVEDPPRDCHRNDPADSASEASLKSTSRKAAQLEGSSLHATSDRKKAAGHAKGGTKGTPRDAPRGGLHLEGKTHSGGRPPVERKGVKREVPTDDEQRGGAPSEADRGADQEAQEAHPDGNPDGSVTAHPTAHPNGNVTTPPCEDPTLKREVELAAPNGDDLPTAQTSKKKNSGQHMPSANTDDEVKSQVCRPIQIYTEEELENLLNEIISDREQCIALLKEKICINNQIAHLIKTDFDRVKSQHDKLFVEMEMNGESPPYMHTTSRSRNAPPEWDHQGHAHERSGFPHDPHGSGAHGGDIHGREAHGSGAHSRANHNRSAHQYDPYEMEKTKEDDADSASIKAFGRKHSQKYDEDYNPYTVGKNKKAKKPKKSRGGENATNKLKASTLGGGLNESATQNAGQNAGQNVAQGGSSQMRIRLLSVKNPSQEEAPLAAQTDQADGPPPREDEASLLATSEGRADVAKATSLEMTKSENEVHAEEGAPPHGEQLNGNDPSSGNDKH
ncbi:hypothetical protein, conserved [Plasmodium vivax]|uniref:Inhibitor of growth protein N-terminal histone-binding domain-containing protein n=1 Tax=Plasmodium vivax (strain Salvador I) TaxID=126793 RepID=A5KCB8_PLAVS|nr:hypothetical protein, conserved [Plasmodium vivax]EDL42982.1 hypothetical protein, conserved [Plasmodium vivax]|eukprot:XP_001612709.1 hypothetical protein [Plasmodium vivax Sal-1]